MTLPNSTVNKSHKQAGYIMALSSYIMWGFLAIYWKQLGGLGAMELLATRIIMTVLTLLIVVHVIKKPLYIEYIKDKKNKNRSGFLRDFHFHQLVDICLCY